MKQNIVRNMICGQCGVMIDLDTNYGLCEEDNTYLCQHCLKENTNPIPTICFISGIEIKPLSAYHSSYIEYQLNFCNNDVNSPVLNHRTFGFAPTYAEAKDWVKFNSSDISEGGSYQWMVIEQVTPGLYIFKPTIQQFFKYYGDWDMDTGCYREIDGWPEEVENYYKKHNLVRMIASIG